MVLSWKLFVDSCRLISICVFLICSFTINWYSFASLICLIGSLYLLDRDTYNRPAAQQEGGTLQHMDNPYKGHKRITDEENLPDDVKLSYTQRILDHVLYDVENCQTLRNFDPVKMNTHCTFARTAVLWGARDYDNDLSIEANVERSIPALMKLLILGPSLHLDGFVFELPGEEYGMDIETFGQGVRRILKYISDQDPAGYHCMNKSFVSQVGWTFEFDCVPIFVTTFAPCYHSNHSRYAFGAKSGFILLQPMYSFAIHDIGKDTPSTNWDNPKTIRDKIRVAYKENGRPYHIRPTVYYPMAHDIVKPLIEGSGNILKWWEGGESHSDEEEEESSSEREGDSEEGRDSKRNDSKEEGSDGEQKSDQLLIDESAKREPSDGDEIHVREIEKDSSVQHNLLTQTNNPVVVLDEEIEEKEFTTSTDTDREEGSIDELTQKLLHEAMNERKDTETPKEEREKTEEEEDSTIHQKGDICEIDQDKTNENFAINRETISQNFGQMVNEKKEDEDTSSSFEDISTGTADDEDEEREEERSNNTHEY